MPDTITSYSSIKELYKTEPIVDECDSTKFLFKVNELPITTILRISNGDRFEIYRVEWCPVGDSCYTPIHYGMIPPNAGKGHLPHSGIIRISITGLYIGDKIMIWRSHPWNGSPDVCFK
jgi:hypothetical protein